MTLVVALAEATGRIPVGVWRYDLGDQWTLFVNGSSAEVEGVKPWESLMEYRGMPVASFNAVDGLVIEALRALAPAEA